MMKLICINPKCSLFWVVGLMGNKTESIIKFIFIKKTNWSSNISCYYNLLKKLFIHSKNETDQS